MSLFQPETSMFEPLETQDGAEVITRPSLSYWQDAWVRLKKNTRAIISLNIIILLAIFTLLGPFLWDVDPALQDLNQVSQPPSMPKTALVVGSYQSWDGVTIANYEPPEDYADSVPAPTNFRTEGKPTTQVVRLVWDPVPEADGYNVYRNVREPQGFADLGLPLGATYGDELSYEDRLSLESRDYYYSVVPTDGIDEYEIFARLVITPQLAITQEDALERGLINRIDDVAIGELVEIEFHPLGTDYLGRDMLARLMEGARVSLFIGIVAPLLYVIVGIIYGGFAGYIGGRFDVVLMRFADFVVALPFLLFMILFKIAFGIGPGESGIMPMLIALVLLMWPATARLVRGQVLQIREEGYIEAARLLGGKNHYLIMRHIIPNTMGVILVTLTFAVPAAIFTEAFLSFIGMGVAPPTPSWGSMCNEGVKTMLSHPHELFFPALLISITVLAFNLLGDGLTEALDSKMRSRD
ncbi:MAG: ABC transporter permease [Pseudomonadales bacterium]|nr:ABC transporter permease [Pseudomonadales bacterium]